MAKIVYSLDEQYYYDRDDIENMIEESDEKIETLYQGECIPRFHIDFLNTNQVIEDMQQRAYECGEFAEGYLDDFNEEDKQKFKEHILQFLNQNITQPTFFNVKKTKIISIEEFNNV